MTHSSTFAASDPIPISDVEVVPREAGIYLIYSDSPIGWLDVTSRPGPVYVGKADDGLRRRIEKEHAGDTGRSTLRRTLGALLKQELDLVARPRPGRGEPKAVNFTNFDFESDGDDRLTEWMGKHLMVSWIAISDPRTVEEALIAEHEPPLNLTGWANPVAEDIKLARKVCASEARHLGTDPVRRNPR